MRCLHPGKKHRNPESKIADAGKKLIQGSVRAGSNAISNYQSRATGTLQIGGAATGSLNPGGLTGGTGIAFDAKGNIAAYSYAGPMLGVGGGGDASLSLQVSNGRDVNSLGGTFINSSVRGGAGAVGSVDIFAAPDGSVKGGGITLGAGAAASGNVGVTYTGIAPLGNPLSDLKSALDYISGQ